MSLGATRQDVENVPAKCSGVGQEGSLGQHHCDHDTLLVNLKAKSNQIMSRHIIVLMTSNLDL